MTFMPNWQTMPLGELCAKYDPIDIVTARLEELGPDAFATMRIEDGRPVFTITGGVTKEPARD
jgi:hypothetical protein